MSRYRPPQPKASPYISAAGYRQLQQELQGLWTRRAEVTRALSAAAAEGDRSENAEYIYRKKELRELDRRLRYLQKRLPELKIVDQRPSDVRRVYFGAQVTLEDEVGDICRYRIVGPDEFDTQRLWISMDAPLAKALRGRAIDDEIRVETPQGPREFRILDVQYGERDEDA